MSMHSVKRMAAQLLKCGTSRIRFSDAAAVAKAITKDDVRALIAKGAVHALQSKGVGRAKARFKQKRVHAGRRRGPGSRKGSPSLSPKERWLHKVRAQRSLLQTFRGSLPRKLYRRAYRMIKGNSFRGKKQLLAFIREQKG